MSSELNAVVTRRVDRPLPEIPDLYGLMNEQCDVLSAAMQALIEHLERCTEETLAELNAIWRRRDALRRRQLTLLERRSTTTIDRNEIFRAIVALDIAIDHTRATADRVLALRVRSDRFTLAMVAENRKGAQALRRGFYKLTTAPFEAGEHARAAQRARGNTEYIYRRALIQLEEDSEPAEMRESDRESFKPLSNILGMLERRDIYHSLAKGAKRLSWAASCLGQIISPSTSLKAGTNESKG